MPNVLAELSAKNAKEKKDTLELHLASLRLEATPDLSELPNLETLYLNNNRLQAADGLEGNFRLKRLYLHENALTTLRGSLPSLRFLETLTLYNNDLRDLKEQLRHLEGLAFLRSLDLFGNPLAQEDNYRSYVVHRMPQLQTLDRHAVTDAERRRAKQIFESSPGRSRPVAFGKTVAVYEKSKKIGFNEPSDLERELQRHAGRIRQQAEEREREAVADLYRRAQEEAHTIPPSDRAPLPKGIDFLSRRQKELEAQRAVEQQRADAQRSGRGDQLRVWEYEKSDPAASLRASRTKDYTGSFVPQTTLIASMSVRTRPV
eukprot:tig00021234_g19381.t1